MRDLPNLDFLRSIAVLLVVTVHTLLYTSNLFSPHYSFWLFGFLGVFLFFVHTTLVLLWSLDRDPHTLRFYVRRIFRMYPLWLTVLFVSIAAHLPTSPFYAPHSRFYQPGFKELLENVTLTFNIAKGANVIGASWSLPIEVQMYIVLPFVFFFLRSNRSLWPLLLVDLLVTATSRYSGQSINADLLFCAGTFLPGAMAYVLYSKVKPTLLAWTFPPWLIGLVLVFNAWASIRKDSLRSGWIFALVIGLTTPFFRQLTWRPLCRAAHLIARYSYGIYLSHLAAIAVAVHFLARYSWPTRIAAFLGTLSVLSVFGYHAIEKPMIRLGARIASRIGTAPEPEMNESNLSLEPAP